MAQLFRSDSSVSSPARLYHLTSISLFQSLYHVRISSFTNLFLEQYLRGGEPVSLWRSTFGHHGNSKRRFEGSLVSLSPPV